MSNNIYRLSNLAGKDLDGIWLYTYNIWSCEQADHYYGQLIKAFDILADAPEKGRDVGYLREGYMRYRVKKHYIFYKVTPQGIMIIRILGQIMDIPQHL